ncbi:MAG: NAD(P)/FAD-dependent oxidoreductase [Muribaculaceae bacterium]|nr:NAD(P)/FAD-dependent oxidoreductase [Muribaculaceae bacterium]
MIERLNIIADPRTAASDLQLRVVASTLLNIDVNRIKRIVVTRRSIDARQRVIKVNLSIDIHIDETPSSTLPYTPTVYASSPADAEAAIVVGAGPAGLFAALKLIELGIRPIVLERGKDVDSRRADLAGISREGIVNPDSNYCFGEGGAGAFSDGKLYTRSKKRGNVEHILAVFHQFGADDNILIDVHPHIGSDRLPSIIRNIRQQIVDSGGEVHFSTRVSNLIIENGKCSGVETESGAKYFGPVILATGHSARDVYRMLHDNGVNMEAKGLAIGVRLEHPQQLIDRIMYHNPSGRGKYLPAAEYSLLCRVDDRAVYSFCMCPGGVVIPAASEPGLLVVNGMSASGRAGRWANSGLVVEVLPEDLPGDDCMKMMRFQEKIEREFFNESGSSSQNAPAQKMTDFVAARDSESLPATSYPPGIHPARLDRMLPSMIASRLRKAFVTFGQRYKGFLSEEATLIGCETRTSAPVRITRDPSSLCHVAVDGLFPAGEGAGYAGGIVSAAIDGERAAQAVYNLFHQHDNSQS